MVSEDSSVSEVSRGVFLGGLTLLVAVAALARFDGLDSRELWLDEVCTYYCVHHWDAWPADGPDRVREVTHRAYLLLLRGWAQWWGEDAWGLRSFSAAIGVATVALMGAAGARLAGRTVGLLAAMLAALHPLHVHYSQEARAYGLWCFEVTVLLLVLERTARSLRWRWWIAYAGITWCTLRTHDYTVFLVPATVFAVLITHQKRRWLGQWVVTNAVLAVLSAPALWSFMQAQVGGGSKAWIREVWNGYPPLLAIPRSLWALLPSGGYPAMLGPLARVTSWGSVVGIVVLAAWVGVNRRVSTRDGGAGIGPRHRVLGFVLGTAVGFLLIAWVFSALWYPAYVVGRYDLAAWPGVVMGIAILIDLAARNIVSAGARRVITLAAALWFASCSALSLAAVRSATPSHDLGERARRMADFVQSGDVLVSTAIYKWFMLYEWDRIGFRPEVVSFPPWHDGQLGWSDAESELNRPEELARAVSEVAARVERTLERGGRAWVIARGEPKGPRWEVDRRLYTEMQGRGFEIVPVDEWVGLARFVLESGK